MQALLDELKRREDEGAPVQFWLRDDDAVMPSQALDRFIALTKKTTVPANLAVIPADTGIELASHLKHAPHISVSVHGWAHTNHAPDSEKKQELGNHRDTTDIVAQLKAGFTALSDFYADQFVPLLVPPWNRIAKEVVEELPAIGFQALSTFGREKPAPIRMINTHVDLIDWKGTRGGRPTDELVADFVKTIKHTQTPIGFLTHHLVHDEAAWDFMESLFEATASNQACQWVSINTILSADLPDPRLPAE